MAEAAPSIRVAHCFHNGRGAGTGPGVGRHAVWNGRYAPRALRRPRPRFYVLRWGRGAALVPALSYQPCPMVMPQPTARNAPNPGDWWRPLDRSPRFDALIAS